MHPLLQRAQQAIEAATRGMSQEDLLRHPEGKWCAAEVLEHLARAFQGTGNLLTRCLDAGRPSASRPTVKQRLAVGLVVELGYFPEGRQAPDPTRPKGWAPELAQQRIVENLQAMDDALARCERRFGGSGKLADHPILGPLSAAQWRKFHWVHTRHHMKQIERRRGRLRHTS